MGFNEWCQAQGIDPATLTLEGRKRMLAAWRDSLPVAEAVHVDEALAGAPAVRLDFLDRQGRRIPDETPVTQTGQIIADRLRQARGGDPAIPNLVADYRAEAVRVARIQRLCGGRYAELAEKAITEGWDSQRVELEILRNDRPSVNSLQSGSNPMGPGEVFEAAIQMALGRRGIEKDYKPEVLEQAHRYRSITLQQLLLMGAAQNGMPCSPGMRVHMGNVREVLRYAFRGEPMAGGASSATVAGILGNTANKEIVAGYVESDTAWREISVIKPVSDLKQHTTYRLLDDMEYEELAPDGRIRHGSTNEESYTRQAKIYAKMYALNLTQIINDDLGAFGDIRTRVGRGSNKKLNKVFWTRFVNNSSDFTTARTNYIEGATTNLGTDGVGLGLGVKQFRKMTTAAVDGSKKLNADTQNPVGGSPGGRPEILLVPPELEGNAEVLFKNQNLGMVANSSANIHQNKYRPVQAWQLSDSGYTGNSTTAWYLLNNPAFLAAMVVSFLDGQQSPIVESADADFDQLGVQFRGWHGFGCDFAEFLAGLKSKGAA